MNQSLARGSRQTSNKIPMSHSIVVLVSLIIFFLLWAFFFYLYIIRIQNADNAWFFYLSLWLQKNLMRSSIVVLRCLILFIIIFSFYKNSKCYIMYNCTSFFSSSSSCTNGTVNMNQSLDRGRRQTSKFP